jgi:hypothetical protein
MKKNFFSKIIARDEEGLHLISAYCAEANIIMANIKFLPSNKIFLLSLDRLNKEIDKKNLLIRSICKFEFIESVRSKNIDQNDKDLSLKLLAIDLLKSKNNYEINLLFSENRYITLLTEIIEVTLEDQKEIN